MNALDVRQKVVMQLDACSFSGWASTARNKIFLLLEQKTGGKRGVKMLMCFTTFVKSVALLEMLLPNLNFSLEKIYN